MTTLSATSVPAVEPYSQQRRVPVDLGSPCVIWDGDKSDQRYGRVMIAGKTMYVHRVAYQLHVGPIKRGWEVDHLCHNAAFDAGLCAPGPCAHRTCFNPGHLDSVPSKINSARGGHPLHVARRLDVCRKGLHDLTDPANVKMLPDGRRRCRPCANAAHRAWWAKRKAPQQ